MPFRPHLIVRVYRTRDFNMGEGRSQRGDDRVPQGQPM
jgi:hypothetical protein